MSEQRPDIQILPPAVANRIAAGEVVERPAAVVKELVENSLDAGATKITIVVEDAGRSLIRVVDDGYGLTAEEMQLAVERHSTSKIRRFEDLESLSSFGFRGEALPSIAAVSRMEILSQLKGSDIGARMKIAGGVIEGIQPAFTTAGTSISVSHLFYNVPARRKFLRTDATEFRWILLTLHYFALAFPQVGFQFYRRNELLYDLPATDDPRPRIAGMFGDDVAEELLEVNDSSGWLSVKGWISPPGLSQRLRDDQYLFMNRRPIVHKQIQYRIMEACKPYFKSGEFPIYVLFLGASPDRFDINVHPAKREIKFADEQGAANQVWSVVRQTFERSRRPEELISAAKAEDDPLAESPFGEVSSEPIPINAPTYLRPYTAIPRQRGQVKEVRLPFPKDQTVRFAPVSNRRLFDPDASPELTDSEIEKPRMWQVFNTFIVSPLKGKIVFIDQHIAHERILYERALKAMESLPWESQQLLFPTTFEVSEMLVPIVEEALFYLRAMGFEVENVSPRGYRLLSIPVGVRITHEKDMLLGIIDELNEKGASEADPRHTLAAAFACRGAVRAGQPLKDEDMRRLVDELFRLEDPEFCPHGRPVYQILEQKEVERWFGR